jgi:peptidoglycan/LPS O-acetylase OafA/YrhL
MNQDRHLRFLDTFRGVAILAVVVVHYFGPLTDHAKAAAQAYHHTLAAALIKMMSILCNAGGYGVAIFFIVSGFCIHLSYRRSQDAAVPKMPVGWSSSHDAFSASPRLTGSSFSW